MTARRRTFLRFTLMAAVLLGLGAVTTVVVAWGLDLRLQSRPAAATPAWSGSTGIGLWNEPGIEGVLCCQTQESGFGAEAVLAWQEPGIVNISTRVRLEPFESLYTGYPAGVPAPIYNAYTRRPLPCELCQAILRSSLPTAVMTSGWPSRAFYRKEIATSSANLSGTPLDATWVRVGHWDIRGLSFPLRLIWSGFVADAGLYAAVWYLLLLAPRQARRALRRRRGACVQCGYDLAGLADGVACPECGCGRDAKSA